MSEFSELIQLMRKDPKAVEKAFRDNPELARRILDTDELGQAGESVSVDGFRLFYREVYGRPLPYVDEPVAEAFAEAFKTKKGVIYESWRGRGKSTFFAAWCPYVMGVRPVGSTALIRVNDGKAKEMGKVIASLIETNPGWKRIFPHVIPDTKAGWSVENGFNVLDARQGTDDLSYARWRMMCFADHLSEQSLVSIGVESGSGIGIHPTNGEWFDDIHDEDNTRSQAEMKKVVDLVKGNFVPSWFSAGGSPTLGVFCTPWSKNPPDAYQVMMETGLFIKITTPIFVKDEAGDVFPPTNEKVKLTWPEVFPMERVVEMYHASKTRFGQFYLCDVELSKPKNMRYQEFPPKEIKWNQWPMVVGVDPVGTIKGISSGTGISHFAMCYALKTPYNTVVIADGVVEKCDAEQGERHVVEAQRTYSRTFQRASVENNGVGALFIGMLSRNQGLRYASHNTNDIGRGSKEDRQYRFLQPLFANGTVLVSEAETPYLTAVRAYLDTFPNIDKSSYLWDVGDSLVLAIFDIPEVWTKVTTSIADPLHFWAKQKKHVDPYASILENRR